MAGWTSNLHPRDGDGKFQGKAGRRAGRAPVTLVGKGRTLRYSRVPTRGEMAATIGVQAAVGAGIGGRIGGRQGAQLGGSLAAANAALKVAVLTRRTKKLSRPNTR